MNKTVIITGGSRGIGRATVELFAKNGYNTAFCYKNSESKAKELETAYKNVTAFRADVSKESELSAFFDFVIDKYGAVDCVVSNAGISQISLFTDITEEQFDGICGVNFKGTFLTLKLAAKHMIRQKRGSIVTVSSMWGQTGGSCEAVYSATKAAVIGLTKALAKELAPSGITVNCVSPGAIDTEMNSSLSADTLAAIAEETPLGRLGKPEEVAAAVVFLASDGASFITGQDLGVNGGLVI